MGSREVDYIRKKEEEDEVENNEIKLSPNLIEESEGVKWEMRKEIEKNEKPTQETIKKEEEKEVDGDEE